MKYTILAYSDIKKTSVLYSIVFDAVTGASESYTNTVTAHTVEDGGVINDHVIQSKDKINIEGIVSDLSFNQGDSGLAMFAVDGSILTSKPTETYSTKIKNALRDIVDKTLPCSVKVSDRLNGEEIIDKETFPCLIESLNLDNNGGQFGFIQPKITFVPVRIASLQFIKLTAQQEALPALKNQNDARNAAATKTSSDGSGDGKTSSDGKEVPLDLTKDKTLVDESGGTLAGIRKTTETNERAIADGMYEKNAKIRQRLEAAKKGN